MNADVSVGGVTSPGLAQDESILTKKPIEATRYGTEQTVWKQRGLFKIGNDRSVSEGPI